MGPSWERATVRSSLGIPRSQRNQFQRRARPRSAGSKSGLHRKQSIRRRGREGGGTPVHTTIETPLRTQPGEGQGRGRITAAEPPPSIPGNGFSSISFVFWPHDAPFPMRDPRNAYDPYPHSFHFLYARCPPPSTRDDSRVCNACVRIKPGSHICVWVRLAALRAVATLCATATEGCLPRRNATQRNATSWTRFSSSPSIPLE